MSGNNIEQMKKLIEEKKKKSSQQGYSYETPNEKKSSYKKVFKSNKRGGALNK